MTWRKETGDWMRFRKLPGVIEVDFHDAESPGEGFYHYNMQSVYDRALKGLTDAYSTDYQYVIFTHGHSTSGPGRKTARSTVRALMRGPEATPYIIRKDCIEHPSVFIAAIRPRPK